MIKLNIQMFGGRGASSGGSSKKTITTPSGKYTAKQLKARDTKIKNLYKSAWAGKITYKQLNDKLEDMVKKKKVSRGELQSLQYDASFDDGYLPF